MLKLKLRKQNSNYNSYFNLLTAQQQTKTTTNSRKKEQNRYRFIMDDREPIVRVKKMGAWYYPRDASEKDIAAAAQRAKTLGMDFVIVSVPGKQLAEELKQRKVNPGSTTELDTSVWGKTMKIIHLLQSYGLDVIPMTLQVSLFGLLLKETPPVNNQSPFLSGPKVCFREDGG